MDKRDKNTKAIEPSMEIVNQAVLNINSNNISDLNLVVKKMLNDFPKGSTSWLFSAVYENLIGDTKKAEKAILKTLEINPNYGEAHRVYSDIFKKKGDPFLTLARSWPKSKIHFFFLILKDN